MQRGKKGSAALEYGFVAALVAIGLLVAMTTIKDGIAVYLG